MNKTKNLFGIFSVTLVTALAAAAQENASVPYDQKIDVVYGEVHGTGLLMDVFTRQVPGWELSCSLDGRLTLNALNRTLRHGQPDIHHSDQGSQYTSVAFGQRCAKLRVRPSMGSVGDAYDNAMAESFFASLECELIERRSFQSKSDARLAVLSYIEGWYSPRRRHSGLGRVSPINFERSQHTARSEKPIAVPEPA